ncbi:Abi family protein [bacterium]|nr:Abi family protein [bacterium]
MDNILTDDIVKLFSESRLSSYKFDFTDDNYIVLERYLYNIELSKSLYPLLSLLEITLRNRINQAIEKTIKSNWLIQEFERQDILLNGEYKKLLDAKQKLIKKGHKNINKDDLIAELSLGFWIHLCTKRYKTKLWHAQGFFRTVFADYPNFSEFDKLSKIFPILQIMLQLRNRVSHHEIIINHPYGIKNCYIDLKKLLGYISQDCLQFLDKICDFEKVYKQKP